MNDKSNRPNPKRRPAPPLLVMSLVSVMVVASWGAMAVSGVFRQMGPRLTVAFLAGELVCLVVIWFFVAKKRGDRPD